MASSLLLVFALFLAPTCEPASTAPATAVVGADPVEVLGQWLKLYFQDRLDVTGSKLRLRGRNATMRDKDFVSITSGLFADQDPERWSHEQELERLCSVVAGLQTATGARALLEVAAVGLDEREYAPAMNPVLVRQIGEKHLAQLTAGACRERLLELATAGATAAPLRAAALRALGAFRDALYLPALENALGDRLPNLRLAAAQAMARSELMTAVPALADRLLNEPEPNARIAMIDALTAIATKHGAEVPDRDRRRAVSAVLDSLGKLGWNVDLAALDYLRQHRSADTVPGLIRVLEAYFGEDNLRKDPNKSALVPYRAHELLVSLTGAVFPADQTSQWQKWWAEVRDTFTLAEPKAEVLPADAAKRTGSGSFFGVPVRGTRVLFIVDASGSMRETWGDGASKFDVAKRELRQAVERLAADSAFSLVWFHDRADSWRENLTTATKANKESFYKELDKLELGRSTNVWAGLARALAMKTIEQNARYATLADEVFVLSDGAPTTGEIVRPEQILQTVTETNRISRIRINTIYIETPRDGGGGGGGGGGRGGRGGGGRGGRPGGMSGGELMKQLAERNGGLFLRPEPPKR